jgi:hypothetical protein
MFHVGPLAGGKTTRRKHIFFPDVLPLGQIERENREREDRMGQMDTKNVVCFYVAGIVPYKIAAAIPDVKAAAHPVHEYSHCCKV